MRQSPAFAKVSLRMPIYWTPARYLPLVLRLFGAARCNMPRTEESKMLYNVCTSLQIATENASVRTPDGAIFPIRCEPLQACAKAAYGRIRWQNHGVESLEAEEFFDGRATS